MKKSLTACLILALLLQAVPVSAKAEAQTDVLPLSSPSAVLMALDGTVLYEKDAHTPREPASVTKIMTLLLLCEAVDNGTVALSDPVTASAHAASMGGSQIWLEEGEVLTVEEMIKCVTVVSANDCAVALGEHLCGSEEAFAARMNERAAELGMKDTHFVNACGLPAEGHVTSAYDIALMSAQLLREHPWICDYTLIWQDSIRNGASVLTNTNKLLKDYPGITGLKTGYTSTAGYCMSATAQRDGLHLIAAVMAGDTKEHRNGDACALLNWGFANYAAVMLTADQPILPVPVVLGTKEAVLCRLAEQAPAVLPRAALSALTKRVELTERVSAPVLEGDTLGELIVEREGEIVCRIPICAAEEVPRLTLWQIFCRTMRCITAQKEK